MKTINQNYKAIKESYTEYLQTLGFSNSVIYNYPIFVKNFLIWLEQKGINRINQITTKNVFAYFNFLEHTKGERTKQTFSTSHLNRQFGAIDKFLEFLHQIGLETAPIPTCYLLERTRKKPLHFLTQEEIQILYNTIDFTFSDLTFNKREARQMTIKLMLDLCYGCGLRRTEALNLKISDINFDNKVIHIKQGKNYKDRFVPMSKKVYEGLYTFVYQYRKSYPEHNRSTYLYPFGSNSIAKTIEMLVKKCNNEEIKTKKPTLHTLRHSIATHLLQNGMDIENIARFLGHSTLESTKIYTHIINEYCD